MTVLALAKAGDNIISSRNLYSGTFQQLEMLLPDLGIETRFLSDDSPEAVRCLIDDRTKLVFAESIGNPRFSVPDYEVLVQVAHEVGIPVVVSGEKTRVDAEGDG